MAVDYYLKIDTVPGGEKGAKAGYIKLDSWNWGVSREAVRGKSKGTVALRALQFVAKCSKATPKLMEAIVKGNDRNTGMKTATLSCCDVESGTPKEYLQIKLENVTISRFNTGGSLGQSEPVDSGDLNFSKITFKYTDGNVEGTWDAETDKPQ